MFTYQMLSVLVFAGLKTLERKVSWVAAQTRLATTQSGRVEGIVDGKKRAFEKSLGKKYLGWSGYEWWTHLGR